MKTTSVADRHLNPSVLILVSGFGLGFYIPGLLIRDRLRLMDIPANAEVFESLICASKLELVERNRQVYHADFRVALASQRIPNDIRQSLDPYAVKNLLDRWKSQGRQYFACLSGHWIHILNLYREQMPGLELYVDLLHLDADASPSWKQMKKLVPDYFRGYREAHLYDSSLDRVLYRIDTNAGKPLPFDARNDRLVVHGGGWGIGTYQARIPELQAAGFSIDVVGYTSGEIADASPSKRYYIEDTTWKTWHLDEKGDCQYPPSGRLLAGCEEIIAPPQIGHHGLLEVIRSARAIVSKPGAGTLIDSLGSATPLIMLEPFGAHEEANAKVWEASGYGISYRDWIAKGASSSLLEQLHFNLIKSRENIADYAQALGVRFLQSST